MKVTAILSRVLQGGTKNEVTAIVVAHYRYDGDSNKHLIHNARRPQLYMFSENRIACRAYLIDAEQNIQNALSYSSVQ